MTRAISSIFGLPFVAVGRQPKEMSSKRFQELASSPPILVLLGDAVIYVGQAFDLSPHRIAVTAMAIAIDAPFDLQMPGDDHPSSRDFAIIPARTLHQLRAKGIIAFVYTGMPHQQISVVDHGRAAALANRIADAAGDAAAALKHAATLLALLGVTDQHRLAAIAIPLDKMKRAPAEVPTAAHGAALAGMPTQSFRRHIKAHTGMTFGQHRRSAMVNAAIRSLALGDNLTGAALDAGFSSSAHFSSAVRQMFGLAPSTLLRSGLRIVTDKEIEGTAAN